MKVAVANKSLIHLLGRQSGNFLMLIVFLTEKIR